MTWPLGMKAFRSRRRPAQLSRSRAQLANRLHVESLEDRALLSATPLGNPPVGTQAVQASPMAAAVTSTPQAGYSPSSVDGAYSVSPAQLTGAGQTIAIVDAYDDPTIAQDLQAFDQAYGLPAANFSKVEMTSNGQLPGSNPVWAAEEALDVEWAHAVAPGATILLVEAYNSSVPNLMSAVDYARNAPDVSVVSMSWGMSEFTGEAAYDSYFTTPAGHTPVAFVAAAGDAGTTTGATWPAVADEVLAVGGTTLTMSPDGTYGSEAVWSGTSSGTSTQVSEPPYQLGVQSSGMRMTPDVSWDANPATGFAVYDSFDTGGASSWQDLGGTSAGAPQWAGLIAMADQGRAAAGEAAISNAPAAIYGLPSTDFHSPAAMTAGSATGIGSTLASNYSPQVGLGSPVANLVVADLINSGAVDGTPASGTSNVATVSGTIDGPVNTLGNPSPPASSRGPATPAGSSLVNAQPYTVILYGTPAGPPSTSAAQPTVAVTTPSEGATAPLLSPAQSAASSLAGPNSTSTAATTLSPAENSLGANLGNTLRPLEHDGNRPNTGDGQGGSAALGSDLAKAGTDNDWALGRGGRGRPGATGPRSLAGRPAPQPEEDADSLSAIDNLFASGQWMDQILAAHPTATLPASFASEAEAGLGGAAGELGQLAADAAASQPASSWSNSRVWIAAALGLGAFWQMRRGAQAEQKSVAAGGAPPSPSTLSLGLRRVTRLWNSGRVRVK